MANVYDAAPVMPPSRFSPAVRREHVINYGLNPMATDAEIDAARERNSLYRKMGNAVGGAVSGAARSVHEVLTNDGVARQNELDAQTRAGQHSESARFRSLFGMTPRPGDPERPAEVQHRGPVGDFATRALASVWDMFASKPQPEGNTHYAQGEMGPPRTAMMPPSEGRVNRPKKGKGDGGTGGAPKAGDRGVLDGEVEKLAQEDEGVKEMKRLIGQYEKKKEINLAPVIALVDSWTGSNLAPAYNRPMTDDERKQTVLALKEKIVQREADARYKKDYLLAMAKQAQTSRLNKQDELASRERLAHIAGRYKLASAKAPDENKTPDRLLKVHQDSILYVAKKRHGDPKDPESKDFKAYKTRIHEEALDMAQWDVAQGKSPDMNTAYSAAMKELVDFPNGRDAAGAE